jgi:hypothetical protein
VNWFPAAIRQFFDRHQTAVGVVKTKQWRNLITRPMHFNWPKDTPSGPFPFESANPGTFRAMCGGTRPLRSHDRRSELNRRLKFFLNLKRKN